MSREDPLKDWPEAKALMELFAADEPTDRGGRGPSAESKEASSRDAPRPAGDVLDASSEGPGAVQAAGPRPRPAGAAEIALWCMAAAAFVAALLAA